MSQSQTGTLLTDFKAHHLQYINVQKEQQAVKELFTSPEYISLLLYGYARTYIENGKIMGCAGIFDMTEYMGRAWAIIAQEAGKSLIGMTREMKRFIITSNYDRIETPVRRDFTNGHRWCKMLGFINETPEHGMKYYGADGCTYDMYAIFPKELNDGFVKSV